MADDDLPDAPWANQQQDNDLPDAPWANQSSPEDSSTGGAFVRGAAHGAIPAAGGVLAGIGTGAALGTMGAGPVGTLVGGLAGGIVAGGALEKGEDWLLDKMGWRDKAQEQADQEQHPTARMLGEMAPAALSLHPSGSLMQRGVGAAVGGVASAATDLLQNGEVDPSNVLMGAGMGAAFPSVNRLGAAAERAGQRAGVAMGGKGAVPGAPPAEAPSRDLKLTEDQYTEAEPTASTNPTELAAAQDTLSKLDPSDPMRAHVESYIDELSKAPKQADGQATPSTPPTVARGVAESRPAPSQDPTISGNEGGAPMLQRVAARTSDPTRDYRKLTPDQEDMRGGSAWGASDEDVQSTVISTDAMHPDIAAALKPDEPQSTFQQKTVQPGQPTTQPASEQGFPAEGAAPPSAPVETGLPQAPATNPQQLVQQATQQAMRRPIVETPMPSGANSSKDMNGPVYVDPSVPVPLRRPVAVHETVEQTLMAQGMKYPQAHEIATKAEEDAVRAAGMDVAKYREQWKGILANVERQPYDPSRAPQDMHVDPEQAIGHYAPRQAGAPAPEGHIETGITAAVTAVRNKLTAVGFNKALAAFDALSPAIQAEEAPKFMALTENTRAPRKTEGGVGYRSKEHKARIEGSTSAVTQAVGELKPSSLSLERTPDNKAAIREHAEDLYERAKELYNGKDPVKYVKGDETSGYVPTDPSPAHNLVIRARKVATNAKATWATLEDYVHAVALNGETGKNVDAGIAMSRRPDVDVVGSTAGDKGRETFEPVPDVAAGKDNSYVEDQNRLRDYVNELSPADYATLSKEHDVGAELDEPADPAEVLGNFKQTLAAAGGRRPGKIELVPAEDVEGGKKTRITSAADLDRFAPTEEGAKASEGKSLKGSPEFEALAAKYGNAKAPDRTGMLENALNTARGFVENEAGGAQVPKFIQDFFTPRPYDPESPHRDAQITKFLDYAPTWFRQRSNQIATNKGWIESNGRAAAAHGLTQDELKQVRDAYDHKTERSLPGKLYDFAKDTYEPILAKVDSTYQDLVDLNKSLNLGLDLEDPHLGFDTRHTPHQRVGEDISDKQNVNVVTGKSLGLWSPATETRNFVTLYDQASGNKLVMHREDGKFSIVQNGSVRPLTKLPSTFTGKIGDTLPLFSGGKKATFVVDHAAADEVEAATKNAAKPEDRVEYEKNPIEVASNRLNQLQTIKANIETLQKFKDDPLWTEKLTTTDKDVARDRGWDIITSKHPDFEKRGGKDLYMPRNVRWMVDDAFRQGFGNDDANFLSRWGSGLARVFMTFGSPIHVANIATNAIIGRGFDNITPKGIRALGITGVRAFKAVNDAGNSKDYGDFLRAGGRPQFINTLTNDLIPNIRERMGGDMGKDPSKWDPIAKIWGVSTPDLARAVENFSTKEMWRMGDMFTMQKFLENRDFKGMSPEDAAADAHKFLPAYDLPSTVGTRGNVGRFLSQFLADPRTSLFGRYHMDLLRAYAHTTRDVVGPDRTPQERLKGIGQLLVAGGLMYVAYPGLDKLAQSISGNPDAEVGRRGVLSIPDAMAKMGKGDADYQRLAANLFTPSIPLHMGMQALTNTTWNRKPIVQPMPLNSTRNVAKAGAQAADWTAQNLVPPYGNVAGDLTKGKSVADTAGKFAAGMVGVRLPSDKSRNFTAHEEQINNRVMKGREKNPQGPLEWLANTYGR